MKVEITNVYTQETQTFEGSAEHVDAQLAAAYPDLALDVETGDVDALVELLSNQQSLEVTVLEPRVQTLDELPSSIDLTAPIDHWVREGDLPTANDAKLQDHPPALGFEPKPRK
jgi:hypothetical protein